jgi:translation elongation factor EF-G
MAMSEVMPKCDPVLLEPIHAVEISVPNAFTSKVQRVVSGRRGQILGYRRQGRLDRLGRLHRLHAAIGAPRPHRRAALDHPGVGSFSDSSTTSRS